MNEIKYPPHSRFPSPDGAAREKMLGAFRYERHADGSIKILDGWAEKNLIRIHIPQLKGLIGAPPDCRVIFHKKGAEQIIALFAAWEEAGLLKYLKSFAGTFASRMIRGSHTNLSNHAFGSAFDINAAWNGLGHQPSAGEGTVLPLVPLANAHGFFWGGHYSNRLDGMHFELAVLDMFPAENHQAVAAAAASADHLSLLPVSTISAAASRVNPANRSEQTALVEPDAPAAARPNLENSALAPPPDILDKRTDLTDAGASVAAPTQTVTVQQIAPEKDQPNDLISRFKAWYIAVPAGVTAYLSAAEAWAKDAPLMLILWLVGIFGAIVLIYIVGNLIVKSLRESRAAAATEQREQRAHDVQIALINSAAQPHLNTVTIESQPMN